MDRRQRTLSNASLESTESCESVNSTTSFATTSSVDSFSSHQSLPTLYMVPSASRNVQLKNEIKSMRHQIEINFRKNARKNNNNKKKNRSPDSLFLYYNDWEKWLRKHKKDAIVGGLSAQEFKTMFHWFSTRLKNNPDNMRGISVANVVDEFMQSGLYEDRAEAYSFVCQIDTKRNGEVTFDDFMSAFSETTDFSRLHILKQFVKQISPVKSDQDRTRALTSHGRSRTHKANRCDSPHSTTRVVSSSSHHHHHSTPSCPQMPDITIDTSGSGRNSRCGTASSPATRAPLSGEGHFPLLLSPIQRRSLKQSGGGR